MPHSVRPERTQGEERTDLEDLRRSSNGHSSEVLLLPTDEELSVGGSSADGRTGVDRVDDESDLTLGSLVFDVGVVEVGDDLGGGLLVPMNEEPSGRPAKRKAFKSG
jgi:hypothetical protein